MEGLIKKFDRWGMAISNLSLREPVRKRNLFRILYEDCAKVSETNCKALQRGYIEFGGSRE
jgi:hypothetical protein